MPQSTRVIYSVYSVSYSGSEDHEITIACTRSHDSLDEDPSPHLVREKVKEASEKVLISSKY